jgi:hypothetical protein
MVYRPNFFFEISGFQRFEKLLKIKNFFKIYILFSGDLVFFLNLWCILVFRKSFRNLKNSEIKNGFMKSNTKILKVDTKLLFSDVLSGILGDISFRATLFICPLSPERMSHQVPKYPRADWPL